MQRVMTIAQDQLRLAMDRARHEADRDQRAGKYRNECEYCEPFAYPTMPDRQTRELHTTVLCATRPPRGKRLNPAGAYTVAKSHYVN